MFLQSWYELGAIGALLLAIAGATVIVLMLSLPALAQPFAIGTFAAFAIDGAFAWGMWQSWFMCAVALLPIYLRIATAAVEKRDTEASGPGGRAAGAGSNGRPSQGQMSTALSLMRDRARFFVLGLG